MPGAGTLVFYADLFHISGNSSEFTLSIDGQEEALVAGADGGTFAGAGIMTGTAASHQIKIELSGGGLASTSGKAIHSVVFIPRSHGGGL